RPRPSTALRKVRERCVHPLSMSSPVLCGRVSAGHPTCVRDYVMRMPSRIANPVLAVLLDGSGFTPLDEFATAVNALGNHEYGLHLSYDHVGVKRWLSGGTCRQPEVIAEVLSRAWGVNIPVAAIWPQSRSGAAAAAPHLVPCVAPRTLDELAA